MARAEWHQRARELLSQNIPKRKIAVILTEEGFKTARQTPITYDTLNQFQQADRWKNNPLSKVGLSCFKSGLRT